MNLKLVRYILVYTLGILLGACASVPEPDKFSLKFDDVSATVGQSKVTFNADLSSDSRMVTECGFLLGESCDNMTDYPAELTDGAFSKSVSGLKYTREYVYKAYAGNGRNVIYSDLQTFISPARPDISLSVSELQVPYEGGTYEVNVMDAGDYDVYIPDNVDWIAFSISEDICVLQISSSSDPGQRYCDIRFVRQDDGGECVLHVVQHEAVYELGLSSYETYVDGTMHHDFNLTVSGNADFEVRIPEDTPWVTCRVEGRICDFHVEKNMTRYERESEVIFRSLNHDSTLIYRIVQSGTTSQCYEVEISPLKQLLYVPILSEFDVMGCGPVDGWVVVHSEWDGHVIYSVDENNSTVARKANLNICQENSVHEWYVNLTQYSYQDVIEFKDPVVKEICVGLWDLGGDGELSFEEADAVPVMKKEDFDGYEITTFDELKYFPDGVWSDYLFEGSSIVCVSLPHNPGGDLRKGMFKDCRNLQNVDIGFRQVTDEAFMNCTSLKEIDALIVGHSAFMGCTDLEKANQRDFYILDKVFKNCTSLREVTFDKRFFSPSECRGTIGKEAFYGCESLQELNIYRQINMIEDRAFYGCSSLKDVYLESGIPPELGEDAFTGTSPDLKFHVPASSVNAYKKQWPELVDRIVAD